MTVNKMHDDEIDIDIPLIRKLLKNQFPEWAELDLELIRPEGTDNAMYKLGNDLVVRIPRTEGSSANIEKECLWLPKLAPHLPIPVPLPKGIGRPSTDYPHPWFICQWLDGKNPNTEDSLDHHQAALDLGNFVQSMQKIDASGGPQCNRGMPLRPRDKVTQDCIHQLRDMYDENQLTKLWESSLNAPQWEGRPMWIHGDLHAGNLLAKDGKITAVVDFGLLGVGDPAVDLMVAWTILTKDTRTAFRSIIKPDEATWLRARGWALTMGIIAYPYYKTTNPVFARIAKRAIDQVLSDGGL